jgi:TetR/AcrR family transcriptional regulator, acrAB operon repressor
MYVKLFRTLMKGMFLPRRTKEQAAETREQILNAALEVFSRKGYSRTTINDIAKEAGITKGAVYWHFKNKPDLLAGMINHHETKFCEDFQELKLNTIKEFRDLLIKHTKLVAENEEMQKFKFFMYYQIEWSAEFMSEVHEKLNELREDPRNHFIGALKHLKSIGQLKDDVDVDKMVLKMFAMWMGMLDLALLKEISFQEFYELMKENVNQVLEIYSK